MSTFDPHGGRPDEERSGEEPIGEARAARHEEGDGDDLFGRRREDRASRHDDRFGRTSGNAAQYGQHGGNEPVDNGPSTHDEGAHDDGAPGGGPASRAGEGVPETGPGSGAAEDPRGAAGPRGEAEPGAPAGLDADELLVRDLLQGAVQELEPSDEALHHLRRAVPARRARKRQAVVGMAAAALFIGTAVPALVHVTSSPSADDDHPSAVGHSSRMPGGNDSARVTGGGAQGGDNPAGKDDEGGKGKGEDGGKGKGEDGTEPGEGATAGADPGATEAVTATTCDAAQLGSATATAAPPDGDGKVYGTFRVSNTSDSECTVGGAGSVVFAAQGAADPERINVVDHAAGDAATRLPDPATNPTSVVLGPGMAYEVRFAWVPSESCPGPGTSPDPTPTGDGASGGTDQGGPSTQLGSADGPSDGTVSVTHTAEPGAPSAATTVAGCAGTIYRTGVLVAS